MRLVRGLTKKTTGEPHSRDHFFKMLKIKLLRHKPDHRPRFAVLRVDIKATNRNSPRGGVCNPANRGNKRRLPRAVWAQKRNNLAFVNRKVHALKRLKATFISFYQSIYFNNRAHFGPHTFARTLPEPQLGVSRIFAHSRCTRIALAYA